MPRSRQAANARARSARRGGRGYGPSALTLRTSGRARARRLGPRGGADRVRGRRRRASTGAGTSTSLDLDHRARWPPQTTAGAPRRDQGTTASITRALDGSTETSTSRGPL